MANLWDKIRKTFFTKEFFKFLVVGVINTFVGAGFGILFKDLLHMDVQLAQIVGYIPGMVVSFLLNTYFTFKQKPTLMNALKFPVSCLPNLFAQIVLLQLFKRILGLSDTISMLLAAAFAFPVTFLIMKLFVYTKNISHKADKN